MSRARVFIAQSLDGFIAGPNDELDFLEQGEGKPVDTFSPFLREIGALLMGRRAFEVIQGFDAWHYGDTPVLVATRGSMQSERETVRAVNGTVREMLDEAKAVAGQKDVYVDGGALIRWALEASLIDEVVVTIIPYILGEGRALFAGSPHAHRLRLLNSRDIGAGMVQLTSQPMR